MIKFKLKGVKLLGKLNFQLKDELLRRYYQHLHSLVTKYIYEKIYSGRLGKSRWRRYAYYRGWVLGRYGSDRARKSLASKIPANFPGVEKVRVMLLARRLEQYAQSKRVRKSVVELAQAIQKEKSRHKKLKLLEEHEPTLSDWLTKTKTGQRVAKQVERQLLRLNRLYRIDLSRHVKGPRRRLSYWIRQGIPTTRNSGWKFAVQTGKLAQAWKEGTLEIKKDQAAIIPKVSLDSIRTRLGRRSLSVILSRTLKQSGQSGVFLSPSVFGRLSRQAMQLAAKEMGVKLEP